LAADADDGPTDFTAFAAGVDHASYSFRSALRTDGHPERPAGAITTLQGQVDAHFGRHPDAEICLSPARPGQHSREQIERIGSTSPKAIAFAVRSEFIEPELADIERRLRLANRALSAKTGAVFAVFAVFAVGTVVTSVGLIIAAPILVAGGVAASGGVVPSILKYVEYKASLETSDLYFLWQASQRSGT
jgi:hypothetical protein